MKLYPRILSLSLTVLLLLSLAACGRKPDIPDTASTAPESDAQGLVPSDPPAELPPEAVQTRFATLKGPTAMGLVHLMSMPGIGEHWTFTLAGSADEVTPALIKGDLDVACVPANLASVLYNKTEGGVV